MSQPKHQRRLPGFDTALEPAARVAEDNGDDPITAENEERAVDAVAIREEPDSPADPTRSDSVPLVCVVDAYNLIFQVFHALPEMSSPDGQPVGAVHGFLRDIADLIEKHQADYLFCAFDTEGDTFRHRIYEPYKANRDEMPVDLRSQIPKIHQALEAMGVPILEWSGYEADDLIASMAREIDRRGWRGHLVTSDKDCRQLITDRINLFNLRKNQIYDAAALVKDWGIRPDQVVDFQALVGDPTDQVPGIPLIGPKIASQLLGQYSTLENVLLHAHAISGKRRRENLIQGRETAMLSRDLVRLVDDLPISIDWEAARVSQLDPAAILPLCRDFGFRRLADRFAAMGNSLSPPPGGPAMVAGQANPESPSLAREVSTAGYHTITTRDELTALVQQLAGQEQIALDTETTSTNPRWAEIVGYSFAWRPGAACYIPVRTPPGEPCLPSGLVADQLRPVLEDPRIKKIGQNLKYDMIVLRSVGIWLQGLSFDTMVADYLIDPGERNHSLDDLAQRYLNHNTIKIETLIGTGKSQKCMDQVPVSLVSDYAAEDADIPLRLMPLLHSRLQEDGLVDLFRDLEMPLIEVLMEMEYEGIMVDPARLQTLGQRFGQRMEALQQEIFQLAGKTFNIDSRLQLAKVLFEDLQLPVVKKTKTGPSTDVEVLTELASQHALPARIVEYRQNARLKSTYVDGLLQLIHPVTGRVHTSFKQDVAATGRLSSQEPNLQNIPVRTTEGREIRSAFVPGDED